jgi:hypothetical protein
MPSTGKPNRSWYEDPTEANRHRLTNIASMSSIPATFLEHECDFWTAYLMGFSSLVVSLLALVMMKNKFGKSC